MEESISLDCALALDRLVSRKPHVASDPHIAWILRQDRKEESDILAAVQKLLLRPDLTIAVAGCFRPRLMGIVDSLVQSLRHLCQVQTTVPVRETVIEPVDRHEAFYFSPDGMLEWSLSTHEYAVIALSRLLELAPHTLRIVLDYYSFAPEPFERLLHHTFAQAEDAPPLLDVVRACYRYLSLEPNTFRALWDWSSFIDLLPWSGLADPGKSQRESELDVRWCAVHILSVVYKFSDATTRAMSTKTSQITEKEYFDCLLRWEDLSNETSLEMAGMYFECTLEDEFMNSVETSEAVPTEWSATLGKLKERVKRATGKETSFIEVCGIELPIKTGTDVLISRSFVPTTTAVRNFESIVLALSQRHPILLEGPIGAGKSSLIRELANLTGNTDIIFTHLDDQMDSKTLLGTYVSTEIPGEFKWQPGPLTQAVAQGMWVVFEDIDKAPMEILSTLVPLLEDRKLYIAGRGETIIAADNFCIFATITQTKLGSAPRALGGKNMLSNLWRKVVVDAPSDEELAFILKARFPTLSELVDKLIGTLNAVTVVTSQSCGQENHPGISTIQVARLYSTRDLIKWCKRITDLGENHFRGPSLSTYVQERILMEAVDCLARSISVVADRRIVETVIAEQLTMPLEYIDSCRVRKPSLQVLTSKLQVGRATIQRSKNQDKCQPSQVFAPTGHFMRMLESVAVCVQHNEPVLLVGETGTGKTSLVQHLAKQVLVPLVVLNLSQQSDTVDLLGGYKPVDAQGVCIPLFEAYSALFRGTFSTKENPKILELLGRLVRKKKWDKLLKDLRLQVDSAAKFFPKGYLSGERYDKAIEDPPAKRHRLFSNSTLEAWRAFQSDLCRAERQVESAKTAFAFSFVEGALVKALKAGHWVLLDEVNLAPVETLERLTSVLEGEEGTLCLTERGDVENIKWHPHFRIFACMNPATDVGKRLLPTALRNRFSEFYVDELTNQEDLQSLVYRYLEAAIPCPPVEDIVEFYLRARREADVRLLDGATQKPHYSLRSLVRALEYTKAAMSTYGFQRSLYDGICMSFLTLLDRPSALVMEQLILEVLFKQKGKVASQFLKSILKAPPQPGPRHVLFEQFWVESGDFQPTASTLESSERYVMTTTIREHLKNLARAVFLRKNPVLLQGPTSSGKTSMIEYLASRTGHRFVRINNHEHTDLQEYLGSYVTDKFGKLTYQEGILVQAVRSGHWIVLDELNLAPSDVLEALNRLLDDNRELFVPELQMMIKPHPHFMLFATQNPPGVYGGRKALSRAFRNRFIELHVDDIPDHELQLILEKRCRIPGSYASQMVEVMKDLQRHRQGSKIFAGKHGFITPRDLFRWAERHSNGYEELAMDGYMLLAERLRSSEEKAVVQNILEKHMRVKMYPEKLHEALSPQRVEEIQDCLSASSFGKIVWTKSMTRIFNLVEHCIQHNEPVLLVGDTGCGKTTVCQLLATLLHRKLHILNCHQHSEAADFIGGFRPVRDRGNLTTKFAEGMRDLISSGLFSEDISEELSFRIEDAGLTLNVIQAALSKLQDQRRKSSMRSVGHGSSTGLDDAERIVKEVLDLHREYQSLFVWQDGPLVSAMRDGDFFLVDEISLADDSVLERLNSILDPSRILVLAEKGGMQVEELKANSEFRLLATMNPGGDFGKRELSPALRNRFTEIWVPAISDLNDLQRIVAERLGSPELLSLKDPLLQFWQWFQRQGDQGRSLSVRDLLSWVMFINITWRDVGLTTALVHGACLVFFDGIGLGMGLSSTATLHLRKRCLDHLLELLPENERKVCQAAVSAESRLVKPSDAVAEELAASMVSHMEQRNLALQTDRFGIHPFYIARGKVAVTKAAFEMAAPTTSWNALRVLRALQLSKPVLVEGSPGVGKTSLISAIALSSGHRLVRINLSEQTEVVDLFGSDMPVDGGKAGDFQWSDGAFLQALKSGDWILLDELNLASQSVLEGLNACLDHRGEVYIPELGKTFKCPNTFRVFACQNPISQGGGRKGLPKSFLNRFTKVYVDTLGEDDLMFISEALHPSISKSLLREMVRFNSRLHEDIMVDHKYGQSGSPWEFNLRDILRWCELLEGSNGILPEKLLPEQFLDLVYLQRMRTPEDRLRILDLYCEIFGTLANIQTYPDVSISSEYLHVGPAILRRRAGTQVQRDSFKRVQLLPGFGNRLQAMMYCVEQGWMCILVGPSGSGKTSLVRSLAALSGNTLHEIAMSSATDTTELLGCFEQHDPFRHLQNIVKRVEYFLACTRDYCFSDRAVSTPIDRKVLKNLSSSWAAFQKVSKSWYESAGWAQQKDRQVLDPITIELLEQTVEHLQQAWEVYGMRETNVRAHPSSLSQDLKDVKETLDQGQNLGRFEWIDGDLLKAIESGDWMVLENANLCSPTVLDRLNPLLEPGGTILLNERGLVNGEIVTVRSHPNFRLFLTVDPSHGEVSRAMRNRGVEIFMMQPDWISPQIKEAESQQVHNDDKRQDAFSLVVGAGIPSDSLTGAIFSAYKDISNFLGSFRGGTQNFLRDLSLWISLLQQLLTRGADFRRSLERSWIQTFARRLENLEDRSEAVRILWSQISRQLLSSTQALQQTCLNVAGGWPRPQSLEMFCLKSVEACVERDAAYLEFLAAQQVASLVSRAWDSIPQTQSERLSLLQSERDGLVYFPVRLLQQYWNPRHKLGTEMLGVPKSDVKSPDGDALLLHACLWMLERGTFSDIILRIQWVERCARKAKNASYILKCLGSVLKSELQHELIMQLQAAWDQLEAASGGTTVAKLVPYLFPGVQLSYNLTIRLVNDGKVKDAWMKVAHLGRQVLALRQSLFQWQLEDEAYKSAATQVGSSPLMQSYLHHTNEAFRLNTFPTRVPKVILHYAYPFFTSVRRFEHEVLLLGSVDLWETGGAKAFTELQKSHGALWNVLQQRIFSEELFVFHWMHLKSSLLKIDKLFVDTSLHTSKVVSELQDILRALDKVFYFGSSLQVKPLLWKHGGHPRLFSSKDLNDKEMQIRSICENSWEDADQDEMIWSVAFDVELRRVILEGLSMSMYLRQNKLHGRSEKGSITSAASITVHEAELECGEVLQILLQKLVLTDRRLKEIREPDMSNMSLRLGSSENKRTSLSTCSCVDKHPDEELLLRGVVHVPNLCEFQLELVTWLDYISFRQDNALLAEISAAVSAYMSDEDASQAFKQQILDRKSISDVLEFSLTASSRSPTDLVPHQHVLWIVDSLSSKSPEPSLEAIIDMLLFCLDVLSLSPDQVTMTGLTFVIDIAFAPQDIAHEMWFGWHRAMWRRRPRHLESDHNSAMIEGPSQLFVPAETVMLSRLIGRGVALKEHCIRLRQLRVASKHLWNFQSKTYPNLTSLNLHSCSSLLMQMIVAHRKSFPQKVFLEIRDIFNALEHGITNVTIHGYSDDEIMDRSLAELGTLLRSSQHAGLIALIDSHLMPCATLLYTTSWNKLSVSDTLLQLGHLWLLVGLIRVSLILPVDGCDPVERHGFKHNLLANELDSLKLELEVRRKCELSIGASCFTPVFSAMQVKIDELHQRLAASSVKIVPRPEHPKFREFYDAVEQFVNTSGSFERLKTLSCKLGKGHLNGESAAQEAVAWQGTSQNFIDRLASKFPAYRDFAQPVQQGIYEFKFGLSLGLTAFAQRTTLEAGGVSRDENGLSDLICIMMEYPTRPHVKLSTSYGWNGTRTSAATALVNGMTKDIVSWGASFLKSSTVAEEVLQMEMKLNVLQVALLKAGQEVMQSRIITKADLNLLNCVFSSFSTLWSTIRECQAKREREKNEVFKVSTSTFSLDTGPAPEDENLGTTTSDFGWLGVDLSEDGEEDQIQSAGTHKEPMKEDSVAMEKAWSRMRDTLVENVTRIHQYIFAASSLVEDDQQPIGNLTETERLHSFRLSYDTGTQLFQVLGHCLPAFLDEQLLPAHLMRVNLEHQILSGRLVAEGSAATVDIYADNQPAEVALMVDPVQDLSNRIVHLLVEWPEHPILQQLLKICETLLSFPLGTSIIKALSGVELLLTKAQSWEDNAAKHVSVANELQNLSRLVTRWRKLELEVWLSLLEKTEKAYALSSQHMWFPLYDLLHRPCIVEIHEYLKDTSKSVEDFMHSATFGEYRTRLHILRAFSCHFSAQIRANAPFGSLSKELTEKVWTILYNVYKYYRQFLPVLDDVVVNEKRSLEAELKEHVRLSKWDDRSHYTMTRSSEKSRRTLQKLLKKYNDLLRRSMTDLLHNQTLQMGAHNLSVIACSAEGVDAANSLKAKPIALNESGCTGEPRAIEREKFGCSTELWQDQCGTRLSKLRDLSTYFSDAYPVTKSFHQRLHGLTGKMGPLLEAPVFSRASSVYRLNGVESLELLSTSIITRAMELKNNEKKIAVKKKAVTDLISALREIGLSPYNSAVPKGQRDRQSWLLLSPAEARCNDFPEVISMNWRKASDYYFKNMALIQHFERSRSSFNKDLSLREVDLFSKFAAHLLYIQQSQRKAAHDFSLNLFLLGELAQALQSCGQDDPSFPNQGFMKKWMWQQKHFFDLLQEVVAETVLLFKSSENIPLCPFSSMRLEAGAVRSILHDVSIGLDECKARLEYHLVPRGQAACLQKQYGSWPLLFTARMLADLSTNFKFLSGAQATLKPIFGTSAVSITKKFLGLASLQQLLEKGYGMLEEFQLESHQCRQRGDSDPLNTSGPFSKLCDKVVSEVLLAVQRVNKAWVNIPKVQLDPSGVDETMKEAFRLDGTLYSYERAIMDQIDSLRVSTICQAVLDVLALSGDMVGDFKSGGTSAVALGALLSCINVPLEMIHAAGVNLLFDFFSFHKSVTKLGYVLSNLFVSLVSEGFCTTETEEQHEESNTFKDASGTGMGEGQGKVDVSDQIDNEEQVMGGTEKTDDTPQQDVGQEKVDKGIEMEQEFAGDMRELSEDDQDEDDSVEDQENLDSKMGEANADDEVVDSKLWDNEENTDLESGSNEKYDRNSSVSGAKPEDIEMRGREGEGEPLGGDDEQENERSKACPTDENPYQYESPTGKENEEDKDSLESSHDAGEQGRGVEQTIEESLDFPENLDLDGQGDSDTGLDEQGDSRHSGDDQESNESELPETMNVEEEAVGQPEESGAQEQMDLEPSENEGMNHDLDASPKETDDKNNESAPNEGVDGSSKQHDTLQSFNEGEAPVNADDGSDQTSRKFSEQASTASGMGHYSEPTYMQSEMPEKGLTEALRDENLLTGVEQKSVETENGASKTSLFEPSSSMKGSQTENLPDVNPYRSLGDAMKQWKEHLRLFDSGEAPVFTEKSEAPANEELPSDEGTRDYEFVQDNEQSTAQALGSATREQVDKNSGTGAQRTDQESIADDVRPEVNRMDPEDNKRNMVEELNIHGQQKHSRSGNAKPQTKEESTDHIVRDISSLTVDDTLSAMSPTGGSLVSLQNPKHETYLSSEPIGGDPESWSQEDIHHIRKELEANVVEMGDAEEARSIWQKYEHLTARLSQELAEQLRLILEPTLATKLQGDYRTGKRINMKKIIPYIASSFRKDKIWLRRTKPSKRQYQVVIAIDDSRSMSEAHCGHLAMEALFTICRAMSKLEIGQMAVTSFGRKGNVHLLHDFDQPFSSEAGINMIRQFSFSQDNTIADKPMVDLLQFLTRMLDMATRSSNSPSENVTLQQLVLIIADGRFHEKESLRRCIREASSRRQLLAFIVLDNPKASILDMQSVSFANGAPSFTKYLDSFPFPYYILLRDIEALPQTLADLIRQWFELAQNSST